MPGRRMQRFYPWIRMTPVGRMGALADLMSLLDRDGFGADGIAMWEHPSGGSGLDTSLGSDMALDRCPETALGAATVAVCRMRLVGKGPRRRAQIW